MLGGIRKRIKAQTVNLTSQRDFLSFIVELRALNLEIRLEHKIKTDT